MTDASFNKHGLIRRYNRLLNRYHTHRLELSLSQIADTLACSPRYARALLREMQDAGWLAWQSRPGRGALGVLQCRMNEAALQIMLESEQSAPVTTSVNNKTEFAFSGDGFRYTLSFHRPLQSPIPSIHIDRAGRHLLQMVHAGLLRQLPGQAEPVPGLAHTITSSEDGLIWRFMLRRGLTWHNGEPMQPQQLLLTLQHNAGGPGLPYVTDVILEDHRLTLRLSQPDVMLPHRLADPVYALPHPDNGAIGLGPFMVSEHSHSRLILKRSPFWYGEVPQAAEIIYDTTLSHAPVSSLIRIDTPRSLLAPEQFVMHESCDAFYFMAINQVRGRLSQAQQAVIRQIVQSLVRALMLREETMAPLPDWLQPGEELPVQALLPETLNLIYFRSREMKALADELAKSLRYRGCQLTMTPVNVTHWLLPDKHWEQQDICLGFHRFEQNESFSMEARFRHSAVFPEFWSRERWLRGEKQLDGIVAGSATKYEQRIKRMVRSLVARHWLVPLFAQRYRLAVPVTVHGIACYPQSWPDFSTLWTDEAESPAR